MSLRSRTTRFKENRPTIYKLKKTMLASSDPTIRAMATHVSAGLRIFNYMLAATEAAGKVKAPKGIQLIAVECGNKEGNELAMEQMRCALWIQECVNQRIADEKKATKK